MACVDVKRPRWYFPCQQDHGSIESPLITLQDVHFHYNANCPVLQSVDFPIYKRSRIGIIGCNGTGKSALLKLIDGSLEPTSGNIHRRNNVKVVRYNQHGIDYFNDVSGRTVLRYFMERFPQLQNNEHASRSFLAKFDLVGRTALQEIGTLSGGQKARLVFAELAFQEPHILLLDEPTNHLDMESVDALIKGLAEYDGAVVLVSHNQHLVNSGVEEIWLTQDHTIQKYVVDGNLGTYQDYKDHILKSLES